MDSGLCQHLNLTFCEDSILINMYLLFKVWSVKLNVCTPISTHV